MGTHPHHVRLRLPRVWNSRRVMWRLTFILVSLCSFSLIFLFWSFSLDDPDALADEMLRHELVQPPPQYDDVDVAEDDDDAEGGKTPFRRPQSRHGPAAPPSTAIATPSSQTLWFNEGTLVGREDAAFSARVYQSNGVARVVLDCSTEPRTENVIPQAPRLLASNMTWGSYEQFMKAHGKDEDLPAAVAAAVTDRPDDENQATSSGMHVRALKHVEVQLLRQRVSRSSWATLTTDTNAIVGIVPLESPLLATANELLVEQYLRAEDRPNTRADPVQFMPLTAAAVSSRHGGIERKALHIDVPARLLEHISGTANVSAMTRPLLELRTELRSEGATGFATGVRDASATATRMTWSMGGAAYSRPLALDIVLDVVQPRQHIRDGLTGQADTGERESIDEVYTDALQATLCSPLLVRLYGLSALSLQKRSAEGGRMEPTEAVGGVGSIPLNLEEGIEVMVGGRLSSPESFTRAAGVVPLLYMELDASDAAQPSSTSATRRTVGLMWLHPAPFILSTFAAAAAPSQTCVKLRSTAGATRLYLLPGPTPADVLRQYYTLTGFPTLPPRFLLGYHHGLRGAAAATEGAVEALNAAFLRSRVPLDSLWAVDTAVSARDTPFTWNTTRFPDAVRLQSNLWYGGRRYLVVRTVPTIPITTRSPLFLEGRREGFFVTMNAEESVGWPTRSINDVASHVVDFANPSARRWYGNMLKQRRYVGSTNHTFIALQHGIPSVLSNEMLHAGLPECARRALGQVGEPLPMEVGHHGSFAQREVHQLMPVSYARAAHEGMLRRGQYVRRALVLSENFYAGIQRYAVVEVETRPACGEAKMMLAQTEGDARAAAVRNVVAAGWAQLQTAVWQCVQLGVLGIPFNGANLGAGLTQQLLELLQWRPEIKGLNAEEDAQDELVEDNGGDGAGQQRQSRVPTSRAAQPPSAQREVEQLLVRWYQAGVFFAVMYAVEDAAVARQKQSGASEAASEPWWMRLPVEETTREAIQLTLRLRYALLPYLYSVAYNASEQGSSFLVPLSFASAAAAETHADASSIASPRCYAVGDAVVVCPITSSTHVTVREERLGAGLFDLWTGAWDTPGTTVTLRDAASSARGGAASLRWLSLTGAGTSSVAASAQRLAKSISLPPAFLRPAFILATQNTLALSEDGTASGAPERDVHLLHSSHMGTNWTITIALPPLPTRTSSTLASHLLAVGSVYWDEGSHNSQQRPPAPQPGGSPPTITFPVIPQQAHHCRLHLKCLYEVHNGTAARLVVEVRQTSDSCAEALAELQSHWMEEPEGFAERFARARELRDARQHAREVAQNAQEDRGHRQGERKVASLTEPFQKEDLNGLRLPHWTEEAARNRLTRSHLLHRIRFLFQSEEDAARLVDLRSAPHTSVVPVERQDVAAEAVREKTVSGSARASRSSSQSHAVQVDFADVNVTNDNGGDQVSLNALATTSVFGVVRAADTSDEAMLHVRPTQAWQFVFSLD